jgi:diguanylate cyclase (GGDEF)-like protein
MRHLLTAKYLLVAAAVLCAFSALLMWGIIKQTEAALSGSNRYDIAWSGANARQELSSLGRYLALYAAFKNSEDLEKVKLFQEIVEGRVQYLESGKIGTFMAASPERAARVKQFAGLVQLIGQHLVAVDQDDGITKALKAIDDALRVLDRIKNEAQVAIADGAANLSGEIARKQLLLNLLLGGLLASSLLLMSILARQNQLIKRTSEAFEQSSKQFAYLAKHDPLTGLPNRAAMKETLNSKTSDLEMSARIAMLVIDLDGFKPINDTLGHLVGDELLISTARRIEAIAASWEGSMVSRFGGDEFVVLLRKVRSENQVRSCAETILNALRQPYEVMGHSMLVDASIGWAMSGVGESTGTEVLRYADIALNEAKQLGRGSITEFNVQMLDGVAERAVIEQELTIALAQGQIVPHYQPQVDLITGEIIGVEALARWQHPLRGIVSPANFIPVAEMSGQIVDLGRSILQQACIDLSGLPTKIDLSVNVSAAQLFQDDFAEYVSKILREANLLPSRLRLEITETVLLSDANKARCAIEQLQSLGVSISLDDFGTGYASLSYLREFGFNELKIDRSFVADMKDDRKSRALVQTMIDLGARLNLVVVPEGIETKEQVALLREMGCRRGQGYLFGKPVPLQILARNLKYKDAINTSEMPATSRKQLGEGYIVPSSA